MFAFCNSLWNNHQISFSSSLLTIQPDIESPASAKMDIFFHSLESSFHRCRARASFSASEEIGIAELYCVDVEKHKCTMRSQGGAALQHTALQGRGSFMERQEGISPRDAHQKGTVGWRCVHHTSNTGSYVQLLSFLSKQRLAPTLAATGCKK